MPVSHPRSPWVRQALICRATRSRATARLSQSGGTRPDIGRNSIAAIPHRTHWPVPVPRISLIRAGSPIAPRCMADCIRHHWQNDWCPRHCSRHRSSQPIRLPCPSFEPCDHLEDRASRTRHPVLQIVVPRCRPVLVRVPTPEIVAPPFAGISRIPPRINAHTGTRWSAYPVGVGCDQLRRRCPLP